MTIQQLLLSKGFTEGQDYTYDGISLVLIEKSKQVEVINPETGLSELVTENYFENIPSLQELKAELLGEENCKLAIEKYLEDKRNLIDAENDSLNVDLFLKGGLGWRFANIPAPSLDLLISLLPSALSAKAEQEAKQAKIEAGKQAREVCEKVLDLIAGYNLSRSLSIEQITQMQALLSNSEAALRAGRPSLAKSLISAIIPDEVLVTAQMKADALELLANY